MHAIYNSSNTGVSYLPDPDEPESKRAKTGVREAREITAFENGKPPLLNASRSTQLNIIGRLGLKDIARLKQSCTHFRELIKQEDPLCQDRCRLF
ncbi:F-box protein [Endozoicomonas sp. 8E]|uniref:F-box protein n=1 Tax=Endozoicomonas sp. 8E TaxID=3035692 RepID=UPI0029393A62|nr:F-box protein [Endozoicomonas sp. 8E]WOG26765.1 F-box protein [Endozoicomonas sp. 8E]